MALYSLVQAQKRRVYNQLGSVYHHQLQKYPFRVSESLKIETESQRDTIKCPTTGCPTITQPCSKVGWYDVQHIPFCKKKTTESGKLSMGIQREGYGINQFQTSTRFLKSNRISFAYGLTSNTGHTFIDKKRFVLFLY